MTTGKIIRDENGNVVANLPSVPQDAEVEVRSYDVLRDQKDENSHREFMQNRRRSAKMTEQIQEMVSKMEKAPQGAEFKTISDETYTALMTGGPELWAAEHFQPATRYPPALLKIRPLFKGEVGTVSKPGEVPVVLVLEESSDKRFIGRGLDSALQGVAPPPAAFPAATADEDVQYAFKVFRPSQSKYVLVIAYNAMEAVEALGPEDRETARATRLGTEFVECAEESAIPGSGHSLTFSASGVLSCLCGQKEEE